MGEIEMNDHLVRPIAICVFRNDGRIFVYEGYDSVKKDFFYRPLGGSIEFGEHSEAAAAREIREEVDAEITNLRLLGTLENIFTVEGRTGHEIVMVYEADFEDRSLYRKTEVIGRESDGSAIKALWKPLRDFRPGGPRLVPEGLMEMLASAE